MPAKKLLKYPMYPNSKFIEYNIVIYPILISHLREKYSDYRKDRLKLMTRLFFSSYVLTAEVFEKKTFTQNNHQNIL
jgi:hypothetical protein